MSLPIQPLPLIMTLEDVANLLQCRPSTVRRFVHEHQLQAVWLGRRQRFRAEDVLDFVARRPSTARATTRYRKS